jgi:hypothetical protein
MFESAPQGFRAKEYSVPCRQRGKTTQHKKTPLAPQHDGRPLLQEAARISFGERRGRQSLAADLRSIVSAAHLLPAEVAPPARVWRSLRVQLEGEGILGRSIKGKLEEHTRFPMFKN